MEETQAATRMRRPLATAASAMARSMRWTGAGKLPSAASATAPMVEQVQTTTEAPEAASVSLARTPAATASVTVPALTASASNSADR